MDRLNVFLITIISLSVIEAQRCYTPYRQTGTCTPFQQCYSLLRLFEADNSRSTINFLIESQRSCGNRNYNGDPLLCCTGSAAPRPPPIAPATKPPPLPPIAPATNAPPLPPPIAPATKPPAPPTIAPATRPPAPPTIAPATRPPSEGARFSFPGEDPKGRESTDECYGPDNIPGMCISLRDCPVLLNRYAAARGDRQLIEFIQESNRICNFVETAVCCPNPSQTTSAPPEGSTRGFIEMSSVARLLTPEEGCGISNASHNRVVGGTPAKLGAWPWLVLLGYEDGLGDVSFKCGGSLITKKHILTAGHCIRNDLKVVRLGEHDLSTDTETNHIDVRISRMKTHPAYDKRDGHSDIAMLLMEREVAFTQRILPICIATHDPLLTMNYEDYSPFVAGWGRTEEGGKPSDVLQEVQLPVLNNAVCRDRYTQLRRLLSEKQFDDKVLCVGQLSGGKDSCQGDSGSALMIPNNVNGEIIFYQIGVVSYGVGCARADTPGVYSSVQRFSPWIQFTIRELS